MEELQQLPQKPTTKPVLWIAGTSILLVMVVTLVFSKTMLALEGQIGLRFLFTQRGDTPPPANVIIVAANKETAKEIDPNNTLKLTGQLRTWPRTLHAKLVTQLKAAGASVIIFDVLFKTPAKNLSATTKADNKTFAQSIQAANNVLLFEYLVRDATEKGRTTFTEKTLQTADDIIANAAVDNAMFGVATDEPTITRYWSFRQPHGDLEPTLATMALQLHVFMQDPHHYNLFATTLEHVAPATYQQLNALATPTQPAWKSNRFASLLKTAFNQQPKLAHWLQASLVAAQAPTALINFVHALADKETHLLNFYGGPQHITTVPYHTILQGNATDIHGNAVNLKNAVVFIGYSKQIPQGQPLTQQIDAFPTPVTRADGVKLHGVEIMATAFSNLLENRSIEQPHPLIMLAIISLYALVATWLLIKMPNIQTAILGILGLSAVYAVASILLFSICRLWLPLVTPLFQTLFILIVALLYRYLFANRQLHISSINYQKAYKNWRQSQKLLQALRETFGHFLPEENINRYIDNYLKNDISGVANTGTQVKGICIATDIADYTTLAERYEPHKSIDEHSQVLKLFSRLNEYYRDVMTPVIDNGGIVTDLVGDAMIAVWHTTTSQADQRLSACYAALNIKKAAEQFHWQLGKDIQMPTRIGIHAGEFVLGTLGAHKHFEYRAVGDTVNTATRLENLNKLLGTKIIASKKAIQALEGHFIFRKLGTFSVHGKQERLKICELMDERPDELADNNSKLRKKTTHWLLLRKQFEAALANFQQGNWPIALSQFQQLADEFDTDGPTAFYTRFLTDYFHNHPTQQTAPANWLTNPIIYTNKSSLKTSHRPFSE